MVDTSKVAQQVSDDEFERIFIEESKKHSVIYGAIKALQKFAETSTSKTCQGLMKDLEPAIERLQTLASTKQDFMTGKTQLALKAVCAIYLNMVNKVASGTDEIFDIKWIKEKIHEQSNILAQHQLSSKNRIA